MPTLGAGTIVKMSDMEETNPTFKAIPKLKSFGAVGEETPLIDTTTLEDPSRTYTAGIADGDEREITGIYEKTDTDQKTLRDAARAREKRNFEIVYSDGTKAELKLQLLGYKLNEPEIDQPLMFTIKAKQEGATQWTES